MVEGWRALELIVARLVVLKLRPSRRSSRRSLRWRERPRGEPDWTRSTASWRIAAWYLRGQFPREFGVRRPRVGRHLERQKEEKWIKLHRYPGLLLPGNVPCVTIVVVART